MHLQVDATQPIHIVSDKFISYTFDLSAWATFERYRNFSGARARAHVRVRALAVQHKHTGAPGERVGVKCKYKVHRVRRGRLSTSLPSSRVHK